MTRILVWYNINKIIKIKNTMTAIWALFMIEIILIRKIKFK